MHRLPGLAVGLMALGSLTIAGLGHPQAAHATNAPTELTATLDGRPIPLEDVGKHDCDDFSYPEIRCYSNKFEADARATFVEIATAIDYVTIYDGSNFAGSYMHVSQDYSVLAYIGWNDRISSFRARNSETGTFYVDWFYSGTAWAFCCNTQTSNLGSYNNTFSSIIRS